MSDSSATTCEGVPFGPIMSPDLTYLAATAAAQALAEWKQFVVDLQREVQLQCFPTVQDTSSPAVEPGVKPVALSLGPLLQGSTLPPLPNYSDYEVIYGLFESRDPPPGYPRK